MNLISLISCVTFFVSSLTPITSRECPGTSNKFSSASGGYETEDDSKKNEYLKLQMKYWKGGQKCTRIYGNLEIANIVEEEGEAFDFDFLSEVREISGYLLIYNVELKEIFLPNLVIVRGNELVHCQHSNSQCSLYIQDDAGHMLNVKGLQSVRLPKLKEITRGGIYIKAEKACFLSMVNFLDIMQTAPTAKYPLDVTTSGDKCKRLIESGYLICGAEEVSRVTTTITPSTTLYQSGNVTTMIPPINTTVYVRSEGGEGAVMEPVCKYGHCWGPKKEDCQNLTRLVCSSKCTRRGLESTRCFGPGDSECCDEDCAGGCWGDFRSECHACRVLQAGNECKTMCSEVSYDQRYYETSRDDEKQMYAYHYECVEQCPDGTYIDDLDDFRKVCVAKCSPDKRVEGNRCVKCDGLCAKGCIIPEIPDIIDVKDCKKEKYKIDYEDILSGDDCTIIFGSLKLDQTFWAGDKFCGIKPFNLSKLHLFKNIKEITGLLHVNKSPLNNFSFLRNIEVIKGQGVTGAGSLVVGENENLEFLGLASLKTVTKLPKGNTITIRGDKLCYINEFMIRDLIDPPPDNFTFELGYVMKSDQCTKTLKLHCDAECAKVGGNEACWGPGPEMCYRCKHFNFNNKTCVSDCDTSSNFTTKISSEVKLCETCHEECEGGCTGRGPSECKKCRHFNNTGVCVKKCPVYMFPSDKLCYPCPAECETDRGCTGNASRLGDGGCNRCSGVVMIHSVDETAPVHSKEWGRNNTCIAASDEEIETGGSTNHNDLHLCEPEGEYYFDRLGISVDTIFASQRLCIRCDAQCDSCYSSGPSRCHSCKNLKQEGTCVQTCGDSFAEIDDQCVPCDDQCDSQEGCFGPNSWECNSCRRNFYTIDSTDSTQNKSMEMKKYCVRQCTEDYPLLVPETRECVASCGDRQYNDSNDECMPCNSQCLLGCSGGKLTDCVGGCLNVELDGGCYEECPPNSEVDSTNPKSCVLISSPAQFLLSGTKKVPLLLGMGVIPCVCLIGIVCLLKYRTAKKNAVAEKLSREQKYLGMDLITKEEPAPYTPTGIEPSKGKMYIVQKHELKRIGPLGSGAFGTVYKGVWCPENDPKVQLPVAIKVLQDPVPGAEQTFIDEAQFMASVSHSCLLRLLAICITETPQLVTRLMPHGNLLDYIRKYGHALPSRTFFLWGKQIAEGMEYLQSKRVVHRDLAARNVLVQSTRQIKITDFGLAQMLKHGEESVKFQGGKVPLKWLALESLVEKTFTHASDVWSMGVTLWEVFTLGGRPYEQVTGGVSEMIKVLQDGERLPQPPGATLDLFVVMLKCWLVEPKSRLTFTQIKEEMSRMYEDADRYFEVQPFLNSSGRLDSSVSNSNGASLGGDYVPRTLPPYLSVTGDTICSWTYDDEAMSRSGVQGPSKTSTLPGGGANNNYNPLGGGSFSSYNSKCSSAYTQESYVPLTCNSSSVMSDRYKIMSANNNNVPHMDQSEREKNEASGKVESPREDQEFMREFLLEQHNIDSSRYSMERPYSKGSVDLQRPLVDPEVYLGLNTGGTIPRGTLNSQRNNASYSQAPSNGSGGTIEDNNYINSPAASTPSTVVGRTSSRSKPMIPPPKLPLASSPTHPEAYPISATGPHMGPMSSYKRVSGDGYPAPGGSGLQHSSTNSTGCSRGSDADNVFNYEHVPDHRMKHGIDSLSYSRLMSPQPVSSAPHDYINSPIEPPSEDPFLSRSYNAGHHNPLPQYPQNAAPSYLHSKSVGQPMMPQNLVLSHNPMYPPNYHPSSNYSPATDSNPATPINLNNNTSPFSGYSSMQPHPAQVVQPGMNTKERGKKNSKKNNKTYQAMSNNASSFV
ncbi:receptor tyrosine-protein kinase erbB-2-like isoform X2 [Symsagittifera roscoffensis]|uniref:receptor tyrosine-protein kinase erbB-2-like isoform X2 n=1 Tax=Symsagittifera roscoffensis TaxID=84072 RepID=UPI00307B4FBB